MKRDVNLNTAFRAVTEGRGREFPLASFMENEGKIDQRNLLAVAYTLQLGIVFLAYKLT